MANRRRNIMKKGIVVVLLCMLILSVSFNIFQFIKIGNYNKQVKISTEMFQNNLNNLIESFDLYDGSGTITNESAIKNSAIIVSNLSTLRSSTEYKESIPMSEMLLYLSEFFVLNSNQNINKDINEIKQQLINVSKNIDDEKVIKDFNIVLYKKVSKLP
jgi:hypothetical protein